MAGDGDPGVSDSCACTKGLAQGLHVHRCSAGACGMGLAPAGDRGVGIFGGRAGMMMAAEHLGWGRGLVPLGSATSGEPGARGPAVSQCSCGTRTRDSGRAGRVHELCTSNLYVKGVRGVRLSPKGPVRGRAEGGPRSPSASPSLRKAGRQGLQTEKLRLGR